VPGGFRFKPPYPRRRLPASQAAWRRLRNTALAGPHLGYPRGPEDLLIDADGKAKRIDKAFSWDAPLSAHGLMHMVISNAYARRSLRHRCAVHVHGQHGLELVDEHVGDGHAHRQGRERRVRDPEDHLFGRLFLGNGGLCRSDPARYHLSRASRLHLAARPADLRGGGAADSIRWPVVEPDRDVRGFQTVLLHLGATDEAAGHGR
jgi:hypothetical protein